MASPFGIHGPGLSPVGGSACAVSMEGVTGLPLNSQGFVGHLLGPEGQRLEVRTKGQKLPAAERDLRSGPVLHIPTTLFVKVSMRPP